MSIFGTLISRGQVEQAVISQLQVWLVTYLAEVERQEGLEPRAIPTPGNERPIGSGYPQGSASFRGGLDFETWQGEQLPLLIAVAQPDGDAELFHNGYVQWYEIEVAAIVEDPDGSEDVARQIADLYGAAVKGALIQPVPVLGTRHDSDGNPIDFASRIMLTRDPKTEFVDPENRRFARSVVTVRALIEQVVDENDGPAVPPVDPYATPSSWPPADTTNLTFTAVEVDKPVD